MVADIKGLPDDVEQAWAAPGADGAPQAHGMPTTEADTINADLLAFVQS